MDDNSVVRHSVVIPELYFLISKFLSAGPLKKTAKVLIKELEQQKVLPKRIDWEGNEHDQTFAELERKYPHIVSQHLLEICCRIGPILDKELIPSVSGVLSLLGSGRQSLLRTKDSICRPRKLVDYFSRLHGVMIPDSATCKPTHNLLKVLIGRESGVTIRRKHVIPPSFYNRTRLLRRTLGHLSAVYCVLFDRSGRYIITGADDLLVKLWSAVDGRLLTTFRGASAEITDIAVNIDNTLLAAGSLDRILRVWDLQTAAPIAVLPGHTGMITSVNFCPSPRGDLKYLVTTSTDGSVAFWQYTTPRCAKTVFAPKPIQYHEKLRPGQAQMICASFSPGGMFLAAGSADRHVRVYLMQEEGPKRILETEAHTDAVDSIQWSYRGLRFVSGSKDGTALVWTFESQQWRSLKLNMSDRTSSCPEPNDDSKKLKVTMVSWDYSDRWIITAVNDFTIKIWSAKTGVLHRVLRGHKDELYVLESHPRDENVLLSAGHDGQLFLWDIEAGTSIAHFLNNIDGQGYGGVYDAKWSPDGTMIAATDSHGHILMFGFGVNQERFASLPQELFFHTDYRPLIRDASHMVLDEQTQMMPHLMPPPFLVDVDGNPYSPSFQRLVPGRESCPSEQLVPNIAVGPEGVEVVDNGLLSHLDRLIEALANRNGQDQAPDTNNERGNGNRLNNSPRSGGQRAAGLRRFGGEVEGVRQNSGNWQRETSYKWIRRIYVKPMRYANLQAIKQEVHSAGQDELDIYRREMRRRPIMITTGSIVKPAQSGGKTRGLHNGRRGPRPAYRTRAVREREPAPELIHDEDEDDDASSNSSEDTSFSSTGINEDMLSESSTSESESSDYSDWVADKPGPNLEPPKRAKRKRVEKRNFSPSSDVSQRATKSKNKSKIVYQPLENGEVPEMYRPSEWLTEIIPRKAPYYPQMGDEVIYFRQGHQRYIDAVRLKKVYKITNSAEPWRSVELRDHELVRVIGIKYEIKPPRLCCLKLACIDNEGQMTGRTFTIKYHDMPDVLDFLVLRQTYDTAVARNWGPGDRFRCMIDDGWWMGQIESRHALSSEFPDSLFMCFRVRWDNGEYEYMSPWDMEPIDDTRLPDEVGGAVRVLPEELRATLYQPKSEEWPRGDREGSCRRIVGKLEQVMGLAIAEPFLIPVDLSRYPSYAFVVEYPIDLTTIKARFENHFYRRITSAQFDVRYLATNAEKYNKSHSSIVRNARIITDLCLRVISNPNDLDVGAVYHQLVATYISSESESENDNDDNDPVPSTSTAIPSTSRQIVTKNARKKHLKTQGDWRIDCRQLLEILWQCDDSAPFREPVDTLEHPDYLQIVDTPMDLRTIKEDLLGGNYTSPLEFAKDVRLIFQNSRNYNTNKRSRIYSMTLRLSTLFETHIKDVIYNWKSSCRRTTKDIIKKKSNSNRNKAEPSSSSQPGPSRPGPSTRATASTSNGTANGRKIFYTSDEDDDDDEDDDMDKNNGQKKICEKYDNRARNGRVSRRTVTSGSNKVTSTVPIEPIPSASGRGRNLRKSNRNSQEEESVSQEESETESSNTLVSLSTPLFCTSSSSSDHENSDVAIPVADLGNSNKQRRLAAKQRGGGKDSEDSYKPNEKPDKKKKLRTNRTERIPSKEDDSDDDPLSNHLSARAKRIRKLRDINECNGRFYTSKYMINGRHNSGNEVSNRRTTATTALSTITRSQTMSTSSVNADDVPSSSSSVRNQPYRSHVQVDHNYGEPGPSSVRHTRRMISRHQRNADELDSLVNPMGPLIVNTVTDNITSRLRVRNNINSTIGNQTASVAATTTAGTQNETEVVRRPIRQVRMHGNANRYGFNSDDSNDSDSEDNQPLTYVAAASSRTRSLLATNSNTTTTTTTTTTNNNNSNNSNAAATSSSSSSLRNTRNQSYNRKRYNSDIDIEGDNDDGDGDDILIGNNMSLSSRNTRNQKRPHYNEDSDDSDESNQPKKRRSGMRSSPSSPNLRSSSSRHCPSSSTPRYDNNNEIESDNEQVVSISSRGRIRKLTAKARGLFRD